MAIFCISCWVAMIIDAVCMRVFYDRIKQKRWLKVATVYLWLASALLGVISFVSFLIMEVLA